MSTIVSRDQLIALIIEHRQNHENTAFSCRFVKRTNNEIRTMNCRFGVTKHLKGGELKYNPEEKKLITVFDMEKAAYRCISTESLMAAKLQGIEYVVSDE